MLKEAITIFNPAIARHLLKLKYLIIDIKPHRENKDRSIFVFKNENSLENDMNEYITRNNIKNN